MALPQRTRRVRLNTALGEDALGIRDARLSEGLGRLFELSVTAVVEDDKAALNELIGRNLTVSFETQNEDKPRHWNGFVTRARMMASRDEDLLIRITAAPWLWFLTNAQACRIYEDMTTQEIVEDIFGTHGFGDYEFQLDGNHVPHKYCVQYNESDFNFVQRLLELSGIYYYFEHTNGAHKAIFVDSMSRHAAFPEYDVYPFVSPSRGGDDTDEGVRAWMPERRVRPTGVALQSYDFTKPSADIGGDSAIARQHAHAEYQVYNYVGHYTEAEQGAFYAKNRVEALQATHALAHAEASLRGVACGYRFSLKGAPLPDADGDYVVVSAEHDLAAAGYRSGDEGEERYACAFTAMPADEPFRLPLQTPKPRIPGPQTAIVTGDSDGEEIEPNEHGCVKVTFHWLLGEPSCWVRVGQIWAGAGYGAMFIPRIGDEVIVAFEDGDPDRPIIVGSVYNGANKFPHDPPAKRTVTSIKTNTSKGGGKANELTFDDEAGKENVFLHASLNHDRRVANDMIDFIGNELHQTVGKSVFREIGEILHETVAGDHNVDIAGNRNVTIAGDALDAIGGGQDVDIGGAQALTVGGARNVDVGGDNLLTAGGDAHVNAGGGAFVASAQNTEVNAGAAMHLTSGSDMVLNGGGSVHVKGGMSVVIEGAMGVSLKCGGSFVHVGPAGVDISGPMVMVNSGGSAGSGAGTKAKKAKKAKAAKKAEKPEKPKTPRAAQPGEVTPPPGERPRTYSPGEIDSHPTAAALRRAAETGAPFCEECEKARAAREQA